MPHADVQIALRSLFHGEQKWIGIYIAVILLVVRYIAQCRPDHWLYAGQQNSRTYSTTNIYAIFKRAVAIAILPKTIKLHDLPHSFVTHLMRIIPQLLGYKIVKTTEIDTYMSTRWIDQEVSPLDRLNHGEYARRCGGNRVIT